MVGAKQEVYADKLIASKLNWIAIEHLQQPMEVKARIRYRHKEAPEIVAPLDKDKAQVKFKEPQMATTPGQAVVFYDGNKVMGGGMIERKGR
jgi:tRNA-specific 2-thiouridylase